MSNIDRNWHWRGRKLSEQKSQFGEETTTFTKHESAKPERRSMIGSPPKESRLDKAKLRGQKTRVAKAGLILNHGVPPQYAVSLKHTLERPERWAFITN